MATESEHPTPWRVGERFWSKVNKTDTCWLWTGSTSAKGYGMAHVEGRRRPAHRVAYETTIGPVPKGLQLDHLCRVRNCVRPDHLEPVTPAENTRRGMNWNRGKTHCAMGHPFGPRKANRGRRVCRKCAAIYLKRYRHKARMIARLSWHSCITCSERVEVPVLPWPTDLWVPMCHPCQRKARAAAPATGEAPKCPPWCGSRNERGGIYCTAACSIAGRPLNPTGPAPGAQEGREACGSCSGSGRVFDGVDCPGCGGTGCAR